MNTRTLILVAGLLCLGMAGLGSAQQPLAPPNSGWIAYRNDSIYPVVVQASIPGPNNQDRRGPAHLINPRETAADQVFGAGAKTITITDPKANKVLFRDSVNFTGRDMFFCIKVDAGKDKTPAKAALIQIPDPRGTGTFPGAMPGYRPGVPGLPGVNSPRPSATMPALPGATPFVPSPPITLPDTSKPTVPSPSK